MKFCWEEESKLGHGYLIVQGPEKQTPFQVRGSTSNYLKCWSHGPPLKGGGERHKNKHLRA